MTTALGLLADYSHVPAKQLDRAANFGNAVHRIVELHELGRLKLESLLPRPIVVDGMETTTANMVPILEAWKQCKADNEIEVVAVEPKLCSLRHGYAGRCDVIALVRGVVSLIELKSRDYNPVCEPLQTAAYEMAWNEFAPPEERIKLRFFCGLFIEKPYTWRPIFVRAMDHFAMFKSALALWQWRENLSKF